MKTKYTNLAIFTFFPRFWRLKTFYVSAGPSIFFLSSFSFVDLPFELPSFWASLSLLLCIFLSVEQQTSQEVWSLEVGGMFPSFILAHTASLWFFLQQQLKCGLLFLCCQLLDLICRVVGFSFFFISGSVLWFTLVSDQSKSGQCRYVDEELQVLGRRCTHKELKDLKKKKKKRTDKQR